MIYTTLEKIRAHSPCKSSWEELLASKGKTAADDEPLAMVDILDLLGLADAIWAMRSLPGHDREWRLYACDCAERALLREREAGREPDPASWSAVEVSRRFAVGEAAEEELAVAYSDERLEIGFNAKYLLEIAQQVDRENAVFLFNSAGDPTLMREGNDTSAVYVVMPMRV